MCVSSCTISGTPHLPFLLFCFCGAFATVPGTPKSVERKEARGWGVGGGAFLCSRLAPSPLPSGAEDLVVGVKVLEAKYALHLGEARWVPSGWDCGQLSHDGRSQARLDGNCPGSRRLQVADVEEEGDG